MYNKSSTLYIAGLILSSMLIINSSQLIFCFIETSFGTILFRLTFKGSVRSNFDLNLTKIFDWKHYRLHVFSLVIKLILSVSCNRFKNIERFRRIHFEILQNIIFSLIQIISFVSQRYHSHT